MQFLLVEVVEREVSRPTLFATHKSAHNKMCERFAEVLQIPIEEVKKAYLRGEPLDDDTCIIHDAARTERFGTNYDWKIFAVSDAGKVL